MEKTCFKNPENPRCIDLFIRSMLLVRKAIMKRSEIERKYLENRTNENKIRYKKQKNFCSKLYKKEHKKYYSNIELKNFTDNKMFWRTVKPLISNKEMQSSRITLVDKKEEDKKRYSQR